MEQVLDIGVMVIALLAIITGVVVLVKMYKDEVEKESASQTMVNTTFPKSEEEKKSSKKEPATASPKSEVKSA